MLVTACAWDPVTGAPTRYASGRVFTRINGVRHFVGCYSGTRVEVIVQASLNAAVLQLRLRLARQLTI